VNFKLCLLSTSQQNTLHQLRQICPELPLQGKRSCFYGYRNGGDRRSMSTGVSSSLVSIAWGLMNIKSTMNTLYSLLKNEQLRSLHFQEPEVYC